ncbi:MAG: hypothetical protein ACI9J3_001701 [Parvicellaceae bacterium]|jgi:hypothetical protein
MISVKYYISSVSDKQRVILEYLDAVITEHPKVISKIRYHVPFYYLKSWLCYLNPRKDGSIDLSFIRGNELSNEQGILEARDRKQVRSLVFNDIKDVSEELLRNILQEAFLLDEIVPYTSKRKKG